MSENLKANILETIGRTPMVRIHRLIESAGLDRNGTEVIAKVEYFNPGGSVKDRIALAMIEDAEASGRLKPGGLIVEPTSGNTGIGLALVAAVKGYRVIFTMPETMSVERRKLLASFGAELVLTDGAKGMSGAIAEAKRILDANPEAVMPGQFDNPANPACHEKTTAEEIWTDCGGRVDAFIAGVGSGGTVTGVGRGLKSRNPAIQIIAVEPAESPVLSGGNPGPHKIQGIGAGFVPKVFDRNVIDEIVPVTSEDAEKTARSAAAREGLLIGISAGAALYAAIEWAKRPEAAGRRIVVLLPDCGERYLSSRLFDESAANEN